MDQERMMSSFELSGSIGEKDKKFVETWENVSPGLNFVIRENRRGDEEYHPVQGQRRFKLTSYDRMLTEDKIADSRNNPFKNGAFRPIIVPDDVNIETNPNAMSNEDIQHLFTVSDVAWSEYMGIIDSPATLQRMISLADADGSGISHRRYQDLTTSFSQFSKIGKQAIVQKDQEEYDKIPGSTSEPVSQSRRAPGRPPKASAS